MFAIRNLTPCLKSKKKTHEYYMYSRVLHVPRYVHVLLASSSRPARPARPRADQQDHVHTNYMM
jgi:hypothetical protein